ncbi:MAG: DUF4349 domain-containing protein [Chloroflexi bacterium]|nr:DUF4349 domain-containing protein [Chloroflexota bacterium]
MPAAPMAEDSAGGATGKTLVSTSADTATRMIIYNGYLTLLVTNTADSAEKIKAIAVEQGGYVTGANFQTVGDQLQGSITLRVPAESFEATMQEIKALADTVKKDRTTSQDVTEQYVDLDSRLKNLEATEQELRELLKTVRENTGSAEDIMAVYRELSTVRGNIEQIKGKKQYLERLSALATIQVQLTSRQALVRASWSPGSTAGDALRALVQAFQGLLDGAIWLLLFIVPILAVLLTPVLLIMWLIRWWLKRRRKATSS